MSGVIVVRGEDQGSPHATFSEHPKGRVLQFEA